MKRILSTTLLGLSLAVAGTAATAQPVAPPHADCRPGDRECLDRKPSRDDTRREHRNDRDHERRVEKNREHRDQRPDPRAERDHRDHRNQHAGRDQRPDRDQREPRREDRARPAPDCKPGDRCPAPPPGPRS